MSYVCLMALMIGALAVMNVIVVAIRARPPKTLHLGLLFVIDGDTTICFVMPDSPINKLIHDEQVRIFYKQQNNR